MPKLSCESCGEEFRARRVTAKYCGPTCRSRAHRAKSEELAPVTHLPPPAEYPRSELAQTVYAKLAEAERLATIEGQQAMALAAQMSRGGLTPSGMASVSKELSRVVDLALAGTSKSDSVDELRAIRDRKRAATSRAAVP